MLQGQPMLQGLLLIFALKNEINDSLIWPSPMLSRPQHPQRHGANQDEQQHRSGVVHIRSCDRKVIRERKPNDCVNGVDQGGDVDGGAEFPETPRGRRETLCEAVMQHAGQDDDVA